MSCTLTTRGAKPAPLWHRVLCRECRNSRRADAIIAFALACRKAETSGIPNSVLANTLASLDLPYTRRSLRSARIGMFLRKVRRPAAIVFAGAGLLGFAYTRYIDIDPKVLIQSPILHGPNAFDDFQRATDLLKETRTVGEMISPAKTTKTSGPPTTGGMGTGGMTGIAMGSMGGSNSSPVVNEPRLYTLAEKEDVLRQNEPVLAALRSGLGHRYLAPPMRSQNSPMGYLAKYRDLSRLLCLESQVAAARGDWMGSVNSATDAVDLGIKVQYGSPVVGKLTGVACETIGRSTVWSAIPHLSAKEAREAASRLEALTNAKPSTSETMGEEKLFAIAAVLELMRTPGWRTDSSFWGLSSVPRPLMYAYLLPYSKARILKSGEARMDEAVRYARQPFVEAPSDWGEPESESGLPYMFQGVIPRTAGIMFRDACDDTQNRLLVTALALQAYRLEHGSYPAGLGALTNGYVRSVPEDPFCPRNGLRYRRTKENYVLYSTGPDRVDNAGAPIARPTDSIPGQHPVDQDSKGDIVACINQK